VDLADDYLLAECQENSWLKRKSLFGTVTPKDCLQKYLQTKGRAEHGADEKINLFTNTDHASVATTSTAQQVVGHRRHGG
jgi:hypothetical protein